jgi:hypothetical protein
LGCKIGDGPTGTASYLVDTPDGGIVVIQNNRSANGPKAGNHSAAIAIGTAMPALLRDNHFRGHVRPLRGDGEVLP